MKYFMYAILDKVSEEYSMPFYQKNDACAKRSFALTMNGQIRVNKALHDSDFELYRLGSYDTACGCIDLVLENVLVCSGDDMEVFEVDDPAVPQVDKAILDKIQFDIASKLGKPMEGPQLQEKKPRSVFSLFGGKK